MTLLLLLRSGVTGTTLSPSSLDRSGTRALGAPTVTFANATVVRAPKPRASLPRRYQGTRIISFQTATVTPTGQTHTRAIGSPLVNPTATPAGQSHTRALGDLTASFLLPVPQVLRVVQPKQAGRTAAGSQIVSGLIPAAPAGLSPSGLVHTRALGSPLVNPTLAPSGQAHTRAIGSPVVNATAVPSGLSHTRALGDPVVTATLAAPQVLRVVQPRRVGRTVQVSTVVAGLVPSAAPPQPTPSGLVHTRALGDPTVTAPAQAVVIRVVQPRRAGRTVQVSAVVSGFVPAPTAPQPTPASLVHTRALGDLTVSGPSAAPYVIVAGGTLGVVRTPLPRRRLPGYTFVVGPLAYAPAGPLEPAGLVHARSLGSPTAARVSIRQLGNPTVTVAWVERPSGLSHTRALGTITVIGRKVEPSSLTRTRLQGTPTLSGRVILTGIAHVRATSSPSVNPRTLSPASLSHTRNQGAHTVTLVKISRPVSLEHSTRALGSPTARGKMEIGPPSLTRTRAQGTHVLSGRVMPVGLLNLRVLGDPAVNVRTLVPVALDRA
jgi:hypothetical protein